MAVGKISFVDLAADACTDYDASHGALHIETLYMLAEKSNFSCREITVLLRSVRVIGNFNVKLNFKWKRQINNVVIENDVNKLTLRRHLERHSVH